MLVLQPSQISGLPARKASGRDLQKWVSSALYAELEGIALATTREAARSLLPLGRLERKLRRLKLHRICAPPAASTHSRFNTRSVFMQALFEAGRKEAEDWLTRFLAPAASLRGDYCACGFRFGCNTLARSGNGRVIRGGQTAGVKKLISNARSPEPVSSGRNPPAREH